MSFNKETASSAVRNKPSALGTRGTAATILQPMRLLERGEGGEIRLTEELLDSKVPPYVILSHTWGEQEVLLADLAGDTGKKKRGYQKIQFCAEQARRDGFRHFWVDTCCIDRTSSAELQEAISCMFRWYKNAAKCYVYLADVSRLPSDAGDESRWKPAFRKSRWFTRGWTLQELIAPASVEFFSREGVQLGTKTSLEESIREITGIPVPILRGTPLSDLTVSQRMEWIKNRETSRPEDKAYSLLGIFQVYIPLIYGEGRKNAFERLRGEIDKAHSNASGTGFTINFKLPGVTPVSHFVARRKELARLHEILGRGTDRRTAVIHGLGGLGKTQLAVEYAKRHQHNYSAVFWLNSRDKASLEQGYVRIAERVLDELPLVVYIKNAVESRDAGKAVSAVKRWFDEPRNGGWLIIYDNYDNPVLGGSEGVRNRNEVGTARDAIVDGYDIRTFLPDAFHGAVLITTRSSRIQFGQRVQLKKLKNVEDSLEILSHTSNRQNLREGK